MLKLSAGWRDVWSGCTDSVIIEKVAEPQRSGGLEGAGMKRGDPSRSGTIKDLGAAKFSGVSMFMLKDAPQGVAG